MYCNFFSSYFSIRPFENRFICLSLTLTFALPPHTPPTQPHLTWPLKQFFFFFPSPFEKTSPATIIRTKDGHITNKNNLSTLFVDLIHPSHHPSSTFHGEYWQDDCSDSDPETSDFSTDRSRLLYLFLGTCAYVRVFATPLSITIHNRILPPATHITITSPLFRRNSNSEVLLFMTAYLFVPFSKKTFGKLGSYTIHGVGGLPGDISKTIHPKVHARHPLLVRGHVRGSTRRSCHGYPRRRLRPRVVQVIFVSRSVSYDHMSLSLSPPYLPSPDWTCISGFVVFFNSQYLSSVLMVSGEVSCVSIHTPFSYLILNRVSDSPRIYGLLALYGASTCTTTLACLAMIIDAPTTSAATFAQNIISITSEQRVLLLCSYVPFFIIPLCIGVDMVFRLHKLASAGIRALESSKEK